MTRDAAIDAAGHAMYVRGRGGLSGEVCRLKAVDLVIALEVLGLLKFEDPAQQATDAAAFKHLQNYLTEIASPPSLAGHDLYGRTVAGSITGHGAGCIIEALRAGGFAITRREP